MWKESVEECVRGVCGGGVCEGTCEGECVRGVCEGRDVC